ncbi:hypothetical protein SAY87_028356 [Trapa incisa]|uniref:Uncharacterized protein n=1 Tax=Trapa incisa TaxID=236973 RepID=A0AAN7KTU9_9MYRT|nr:hypothetical protein SAY87_028356 [Trapa incisa]
MERSDRGDHWEDELQEFTFACTGRPNSSPISAEKIFLNGQIKPSHPFKVPGDDQGVDDTERLQKRSPPPPAAMREPLMSLFGREREWNSSWDSCSSHEEDEPKDAPGRYCLCRMRTGGERKGEKNNSNKKTMITRIKNLVFNRGTQKVSDEPLEL